MKHINGLECSLSIHLGWNKRHFKKLDQASSGSVVTLIALFASVQPVTDVVRVAAYFRE